MRAITRKLVVLGRMINTAWSNHKWKDACKSISLVAQDRHETLNAVKYAFVSTATVWKNFKYKADGADELWDSTPPPPEAYKRMCEARRFNAKYKSINGFEPRYFSDDCDGYHACLYHFMHEAGFECKLISVMAVMRPNGHCVLAYKSEDGWRICDYTKDFDAGDNFAKAREHYAGEYGDDLIMCAKTFDYDKGAYVFGGEVGV